MKKIISLVFLFIPIIIFSQKPDLPHNPQPGQCYVKCRLDSTQIDWKLINCKYVEYTELPISFNEKSNLLSEKDKKVINKKLLRFLNKGFLLEIMVNFDSSQTDSINSVNSFERSSELAKYLVSQNVNPNLLLIRSKGNELAEKKCENTTDCSEIYKENSRVYYRAINYVGDDLYFNEKYECWYNKTESQDSNDKKIE